MASHHCGYIGIDIYIGPPDDTFTRNMENEKMGCGSKIGKKRKREAKSHSVNPSSSVARENSTLVMPRVPQKCTNCSGKLDQKTVKWTGPTSFECPYCGVTLAVEFEKILKH